MTVQTWLTFSRASLAKIRTLPCPVTAVLCGNDREHISFTLHTSIRCTRGLVISQQVQ